MPIGLHAAMNVARWIVGETGAQGIWTMAIDEQAREHVAGVAPLIGFAVTGLCAAASVVVAFALLGFGASVGKESR